MKKLFRPLVLGGILFAGGGPGPVMDTTPARAATVTDANLKQMLEDLLREHPEIVLDVLRSHSEDVLDIAQAGANARRKAALEAQWHKEVKNTPQKQISLSGRPVKGQCGGAGAHRGLFGLHLPLLPAGHPCAGRDHEEIRQERQPGLQAHAAGRAGPRHAGRPLLRGRGRAEREQGLEIL